MRTVRLKALTFACLEHVGARGSTLQNDYFSRFVSYSQRALLSLPPATYYFATEYSIMASGHGSPYPVVEHRNFRDAPKLRASCNPCAVSKVKCTKERPGRYG